ncbi:MAG: hypothetical protein AAB883_01950 [Patescibacteria group bacterium]
MHTYDPLYKLVRGVLWSGFLVYLLYEVISFPMLFPLMIFYPFDSPLIPHLLLLVATPSLLWALRSKSDKRRYLIGGAVSFWIFSAQLVYGGAYEFDLSGVLSIVGILVVLGSFVWLLARNESGSIGYFSLFLVVGLAAAKAGNWALIWLVPSLGGGEENFIFNMPLIFALPGILLALFLIGGAKFLADYFFPTQSTGMFRTNIMGFFLGSILAGAYVTATTIGDGSTHFDLGEPLFFLVPAAYKLLCSAFIWSILHWVLKKYGKISESNFDRTGYPILWGSLMLLLSASGALIGVDYVRNQFF